MARGKSNNLKPFEKLLLVMQDGNPVSVKDIETQLGKEIQMYRISTYMWHIKTFANGVIKTIKEGRSVKSYQLNNAATVKAEYIKNHSLVARASGTFTPKVVVKPKTGSPLRGAKKLSKLVGTKPKADVINTPPVENVDLKTEETI